MKPKPAPCGSPKKKAKKPLLSITARKPNVLWSLDLTVLRLFGVFPVYVLGVIDHCSRKVFCLSSTFHPTATWLVHALSAVFSLYGIPKRVLTDNGQPFTSQAFGKFTSQLGIKQVKTSVRHPQSNGKIERFFQSLKHEFLWLFFLTGKKRLDYLLSEYLAYYNEFRLHEALDGQTPDDMFYDRRSTKPDKSSKNIRAPIEEIRMGCGQLKAYCLKKAA
jgi:putative transposase